MSTTASATSRVPNNLRFRRTFGRIKKIIDIPNLIDIQKRSYEEFLQRDVAPEARKDQGVQAVFKSVFPIKDFNETASLEFVSYTLSEPKYDVEECHQRGMTFAAPLKVTVQLVIWDVDPESGVRSIKNVKEQEVYFGEIPLMTRHGTFMINGTERVIVSQLHRSPGVFFDHDKGKTHASGKLLYSARIIPYRGSWIDFEFDPKDILFVRIDRRRKFHATVLLRSLGMTGEDLLNYYYRKDTIVLDGRKAAKKFQPDHLVGVKATRDLRNPQSNELIVKEGRKFTKAALRLMEQAGIEQIPIALEEVLGRVAAHDVKDSRTGEVLLATNEEITDEKLELFRQRGINKVEVLFLEDTHIGPSLRNTLLQDKIEKPEDAILEIYRRLRPGDPPTPETATAFFNNLFFNPERYDLSRVGRLKLNHKLKINVPLDQGTLRREDILEVVRYLIELKNGNGQIDDIDHLGNRRVRAVGELVENQYRIGLVRMERAIKERMSLQDIETLMPQELINYKPVSAVIKEFFGSSQLSQFMDQTNPLSEITHKRRLSALVPHRRRVHHGDTRQGRVHGRVAEPARVGGGVADPVPRERRCQPRPHGLQHAAPGGAAPAHRRAAGRYRHGAGGGARLGRHRGRPAGRRGRAGRLGAHRGQGRPSLAGRPRPGRRHLQHDQVPALEPEHLHEPAPDRGGGRPRAGGRRDRRRPVHRDGGPGPRAERAGRLHALGRVQLRGLDPHLRARGEARPLHLGAHRGVRVRGARHQARPRGDHARHPERRRRGAQGPGRVGHHPHRRGGEAGRHPGREDHGQGRDAALGRGEAIARDLRREGGRW